MDGETPADTMELGVMDDGSRCAGLSLYFRFNYTDYLRPRGARGGVTSLS